MKISRRGKHTKPARRGKHTKRAGKHLGYKSKSKKVRGSKRYHRGNKRTYKRGRRFHRGGGKKVTLYDVKFDVKKNGVPFEREQTFDITIELSDNIATVKLVRKDKTYITFTITGEYNDVSQLLMTPGTIRSLSNGPPGVRVDFKNLKVDGQGNDTYDFYRDGKNNDKFTVINNDLQQLSVSEVFPQQLVTTSSKSGKPEDVVDLLPPRLSSNITMPEINNIAGNAQGVFNGF
jgi:hypothetical protein